MSLLKKRSISREELLEMHDDFCGVFARNSPFPQSEQLFVEANNSIIL